MRRPALALIVPLLALAALVAACDGGGGGANGDGTPGAGGDRGPIATVAPATDIEWARLPSDPAVFGGDNTQYIHAISPGGPGLVAVGWQVVSAEGDEFDAAAWYTADGQTWSRTADPAPLGGEGEQVMKAIAYADPLLVAAGWDGAGGDIDAAFWTTRDGVTWTRSPHDEATLGGEGEQRVQAIAVGGPGFIAAGFDSGGEDLDGAVWTSADGGRTWARVRDAAFEGPGNQRLSSIAVDGANVVIVGDDTSAGDIDAAVWRSGDRGVTWTRVTSDSFGGAQEQIMSSVTKAGAGFIAAGWDAAGADINAAIWRSEDAGESWTRVSRDDALFGGEGEQLIYAVAAREGRVVAVGRSGPVLEYDAAVWVSFDGGETWERDDAGAVFGGAGEQVMNAITATGAGFVAGGCDGTGDNFDAVVWTGVAFP